VAANILYLYLISSLGSVFASQSAYFITMAGIGWSVLLLDESLTAWIWAALGLTAAGLFLVGPKGETELEPPPTLGLEEAKLA
jgi:drug/metabolite transporter (DMT)-like permease